MRTRLAGWLVVVGVLVGAGAAGHHLSDRPMLAAQSGTSTSGSGSVGTGTDDGSGGDTSSGGTSDGGGGGGGTPAPTPTAPATTAPAPPAPTPTAPRPTATTPADGGGGGGSGSGSASRQEDDGPDDGTSGFSPADDGGGEHDDEPYTLRPSPPPERRRVAPGHKTDCPADTGPQVRCFGVDDWDDADAVEVPDGTGGTVVVPLAADVDTRVEGTSISGGSNVDLRIHINVTDGTVVDLDRRADDTTQAVLRTVALILLVLVLVGMGGTLLRLPGLGG